MAQPLTVIEVQADLENLVDEAARGEVIPITRHGTVIAEIRAPAHRSRLGLMAGSVTFLGDVVEPLDISWEPPQ